MSGWRKPQRIRLSLRDSVTVRSFSARGGRQFAVVEKSERIGESAER